MPLLPGPSGARDKRRRPPVAEDLAVADTASVESDHSSDADADRIVMGDEGIGYESSGYSSSSVAASPRAVARLTHRLP